MPYPAIPATAFGFLPTDSETGRLIAARDWSVLPLGPIEQWPQSLRTATTLLLRSPVPIVMLWGHDGIMLYNDAYSEFAGGRHPQLLGSKVREGWPEVADFNDNVMRVGLAGRTLSYQDQELTLYRNGVPEQVWMNLDYSPVLDESGRPGGVICILGETTDRVIKERRLNAERDRLWNLSQDMLARADYSGMMSAVSPAWTSVLGWSEEELLTRPYASFMHPDDMPPTIAAIQRMGEFGRPTRFENRIATRDGGWRPIEWTVTPEPGGNQFVAVGRDLSLNKARDAELERAQEALRHAQKMEAVGQLTGGVAHDFNNLLTIIKSSTDLLKRPGITEERRQRYIGAIAETVDRAAKLTSQLLAFARRQSLKPEVFDVAERLRAIDDMLQTVVGGRVRVITELPNEACLVKADVAQFETAVVNMAVNARDAMDGEGQLIIRVETASTMPVIRGQFPSAGRFVAVSLTDTGVGISADQMPSIFEPFFTTKPVGKGTGLGLSQVFGFAKQSGGDIAVDSEEARGTTFTLFLPASEAKPSAVAAAGTHNINPIEQGHGKRILVVEDNLEVGRFSTQILVDLGYETIWAVNGDEALQQLAMSPNFDAVFSDVVMPGMSGIELGHHVRRLYPDLPVILTSGYSNVLAEEGRHGFELLQKPYAVDDLSRLIGRVLNRGKRDPTYL